MALLHTISSVVRLPLRVAGKSVSTVTGLIPGMKTRSTPAPTDVKAPDVAGNARGAAPAPVQKPAAKGPVSPSTGATPDPAAPAAPKKAPAKKSPAPSAKKATPAQEPAPAEASSAPAKQAAAPDATATKATKAPAKKSPSKKAAPKPALEPIGDSGTEIDAAADTTDVKVTPADIAASIGSQLSESTETTETTGEATGEAPDEAAGDRPPSPS